MFILAIDPGTTGAIASLDPRGNLFALHDLPVIDVGGEGFFRKRIDGAKMHKIVLDCLPAGEVGQVWIEDAQPVLHGGPGSAGSGASLLAAKYAVMAILDCFTQLERRMVSASAWKKAIGLAKNKTLEKKDQGGDLKKRASARAVALFPTADVRLVRHHNRAEALLIAHYGREVWKMESEIFDQPVLRQPSALELRNQRIDAGIPFE